MAGPFLQGSAAQRAQATANPVTSAVGRRTRSNPQSAFQCQVCADSASSRHLRVLPPWRLPSPSPSPSACPTDKCGTAGNPCCPSNTESPHTSAADKLNRKPYCKDGSTCFYFAPVPGLDNGDIYAANKGRWAKPAPLAQLLPHCCAHMRSLITVTGLPMHSNPIPAPLPTHSNSVPAPWPRTRTLYLRPCPQAALHVRPSPATVAPARGAPAAPCPTT